MNQGLIDNWNQAVSSDDSVYILGDLFFCGMIKAKEILGQLRGKKHLILGNHDWGKIKPRRAQELGFESVLDCHITNIGEYEVRLSHFPYRGAGDHTERQRYAEKRYEDNGGWLLHGHVHCLWRQKNKMINVGVDVWDYRPVAESDILQIIRETPTPNPSKEK